MFTDGLKDLSITELADETGIDRSKIYTYINTATPNDYEYTRGKSNGVSNPPYLLSERDIEMLSIIHELAQNHSIREVKEMLSDAGNSEQDVEASRDSSENYEKIKLHSVPYFVADFIDKNQDKSFISIMQNPLENLTDVLYDYLLGNHLTEEQKIERQDILLDSWVNGYGSIEDIYYDVLFKQGEHGFMLYKESPESSVKLTTDISWYNITNKKLWLTESEIKEYDRRFWDFREERY